MRASELFPCAAAGVLHVRERRREAQRARATSSATREQRAAPCVYVDADVEERVVVCFEQGRD